MCECARQSRCCFYICMLSVHCVLFYSTLLPPLATKPEAYLETVRVTPELTTGSGHVHRSLALAPR